MKNITLVLIMIGYVMLFTMGVNQCQTTGANYYYDQAGQYVEITDPEGQCVLYRVIGLNTQAYKQGLFLVNYTAIKAKIYSADDVLKELDKLEAEVLRKGATVGSFTNTLLITAANAAKVGAPELVVVTRGLEIHRADMTPLDDCTRYKLVNEIGGHRALALAFASQ